MPNSLKNKIKKHLYKGNITEEEYKEIIKKLNGHDLQIRAEAYQRGIFDLMCRLCDHCLTKPNECSEADCPFWNTEFGVCEVVMMAEQITEEENEYQTKTSAFSVDAAAL